MYVRMRGGSGLGDALYLRPLVEYCLRRGDSVTVMTAYREVFDGLNVKIEPFNRERINIVGHYTHGKSNVATNQWQDVCQSARISVPLRTAWTVRNLALVREIQSAAQGRKIILAHAGREPMGRADGFGNEMLPRAGAVDDALGALKTYYVVEIGAGKKAYPIRSNQSLINKTSVADLLDLASICNGIVAQCSFCVPLAEILDKPAMFVWAARGLASRVPFIRLSTPAKVLSKPSSRYVVDDWTTQTIQEAARALC